MLKKILTIVFVIAILGINTSAIYAATSNTSVTSLRDVDVGTFNEFKYKLTDQFFTLRNDFEVSREMKRTTLTDLYAIAKESYNYLPDDLINKNLFKKLEIAIASAAQYPKSSEYYQNLIQAIDNYLENVAIKSVKGTVEATPKIGNAPLDVTLRGNVRDETGAKIPSYNYVWWIDEAGKRKVIGNQQSINYIFKEEGTFSVNLDVSSAHVNSNGYVDVLPFSSRADITVKEKIASLIIKVNGDRLGTYDELKYTPQEAGYGLIFDATSSTPTDGAKFTRTEWDFGNGVERVTNGSPEIERIKYAQEGEYTVTLKLRTNENKTVERQFLISVHDPIATVSASQDEGYLGERFTFSAKPTGNDDNFSYDWEIIDITEDKQIFTKTGKTFTYTFADKGKYNVKLKVTEPSGEIDIDTQIIYINSRAPVASFVSSKPFYNKPNTVFLDASKSYDLDGQDDGKLKYEWIINGDRVELQNANYNGSTGYFTFDTIADHSVLLKVTDPDGIPAQISKKVSINSILSVDFGIYPRVAQRQTAVVFIADAPEATVYQWDFGDGVPEGGRSNQISHRYEKSGIYTVKLTVTDSEDRTNYYTKKVYVSESNSPYGFIDVLSGGNTDIALEPGACYGEPAYILNRADSVTFDATESIDVTGQKSGLDYTWKLGENKYYSNSTFTQKFDELGCFPIQLTVKSQSKGTTHKTTSYVKVENLAPTLSYIDVQIVDAESDPVVVQVTAHAAEDRDGVIQSYLWYYYTDIDPEPQDFRATKLSNTTFVLPKITGNYYFVAMLKDDNETRVSSEDVTGSKYSITLTGDNINVPLVKINVDDSSTSVGKEVVFSAQVENILGQNLSQKAEYSWDLDGDGFYEKKTDVPNVAYTYEKSGEFYAKVKASYKGYSNTKSLTMNVSNVLKPSVEYISIGNKFVLLDTSLGKVDKRYWDLGDGSEDKTEENIIHTYSGNDGSYVVKLTLEEGIKTQSESFIVTKNVRNLIDAKKGGLVVFSNKEIKDNIINIDTQNDSLYFYVGESKSKTGVEITDFIIDSDTSYDSNINGGKDDDRDLSFSYGQNNNIFELPLNESQTQTIKISGLGISGEVIDTKVYEIQKSYIDEESIDPSSIIFTGISESQKVTIEKIKIEIANLPKEHRLKSLMYVQKLQEEWFDAAEKTKVIVEFEGYVAGIESSNSDIIYDLLESLLLEDSDDKSDQNLMFIALKNLTPTNIECELSSDDEDAICYNKIVERLELIKATSNIEDNKLLGTEILQAIEAYPYMSVKDKKNYKAILSSFVYGGIDNMPEQEVQDEIDNQDNEETPARGSAIMKVLVVVLWIIGIILGLFLGIFGLFYLWYMISNKDDNLGFQDFIIEKTSGTKVKITKKDDTDEILQELDSELSEPIDKDKIEDSVKKEPRTETKTEAKAEENKKEVVGENKGDVPDWLTGAQKSTNNQQKTNNQKQTSPANNNKESFTPSSKKPEVKKVNNSQKVKTQDKGDIPDWLKGSMTGESPKKNTPDTKAVENKKETQVIAKNNISETKIESGVPSWLKTNETQVDKDENIEKNIESTDQKKSFTQSTKDSSKSENISDEKIEQETKLEKEDNIPDWLKGTFDAQEISETKKGDDSEEVKEAGEKTTDTKSVKDSDGDVPDWLKGALDNEVKASEPIKETKKSDTEDNLSNKPVKSSNTSIEKGVNTKDQGEIPDWLKGTMDEKDTNKKVDVDKKEKNLEKKEIKTEKSKKDDSKLDDTDTFTKEDIQSEKIVVSDIKEESKASNENIVKVVPKKEEPTQKKVTNKTPVEPKKKESTKTTNAKPKTTKKKVENAPKQKTPVENDTSDKQNESKDVSVSKNEVTSDKKNSNSTEKIITDANPKKIDDELWDDGMKIPDWLQTEEDDTKNQK